MRTLSDGYEILSKQFIKFYFVIKGIRYWEICMLLTGCCVWIGKWKTNHTARFDINSPNIISNDNDANEKYNIFTLVYQKRLAKWKIGIYESLKCTCDCFK